MARETNELFSLSTDANHDAVYFSTFTPWIGAIFGTPKVFNFLGTPILWETFPYSPLEEAMGD